MGPEGFDESNSKLKSKKNCRREACIEKRSRVRNFAASKSSTQVADS